jgi:hypothetical protein
MSDPIQLLSSVKISLFIVEGIVGLAACVLLVFAAMGVLQFIGWIVEVFINER